MLCAVCSSNPVVYTCPGCGTKSCSLPCSQLHKTRSACSGERNKAAYVPMNEYSWGTMMADYTYLEDTSRKLSQWSRESPSSRRVRRDKRDILRAHLLSLGIDMELLPPGMQRRKLNQSSFNPKSRAASLSLELIFNPPPDIKTEPFSYILHGTQLDISLGSALQTIVQGLRPSNVWPAWAVDLLSNEAQDRMMALEASNLDEALPDSRRKRYISVDSTNPLSVALKGHSFVEFPKVFVWHKTSFSGTLYDGAERDIIVTKPQTKGSSTRVPNTGDMNQLLDGYGSSDEEGTRTSLPMTQLLGDYQSDEEGEDVQMAAIGSIHPEEELRGELSDIESASEEIDAIAQRILAQRRAHRTEPGV